MSVIVPPPFQPVTLAEVYSHLRLDPEGSPATHPDDDMLSRHIRTATAEVERMTHRALVQQTLRMVRPSFPAQGIALRPPVQRIDAVRYYDGDNNLQTVTPESYFLSDDAQLRFVTGFSAPVVYDRPDALRIDYVAGYPTDGSPATQQEDYAGNVPSMVKDAILLGVQLLYDPLTPEQRDAVVRARAALLSSLVVHVLA